MEQEEQKLDGEPIRVLCDLSASHRLVFVARFH